MSNTVIDTHNAGRKAQNARILACYKPAGQVSPSPLKNSVESKPMRKKITADELKKANRNISDALEMVKPKKGSEQLIKSFDYDETVSILSKSTNDHFDKAIDSGKLNDDEYLKFLEIRDVMKKVTEKFKNKRLSVSEYSSAVRKSNQLVELIAAGITDKRKN